MDAEPRRVDPLWTLDELVERAGRALSVADTSAASGRVRQLPDRRAVRWYASTGLVDRPGVMRGRVALYGPRQLLQLVAIKRRQAQGARLADIQAELVGAADTELAAIAAVPPELLAGETDTADTPDLPVRPRFWLDVPLASTSAIAPSPAAAVVHGVALGDGSVLLLPPGDVAPTEDQAAVLRAAAAPLLAAIDAQRTAGRRGRAVAGSKNDTDRSDPQEEPR